MAFQDILYLKTNMVYFVMLIPNTAIYNSESAEYVCVWGRGGWMGLGRRLLHCSLLWMALAGLKSKQLRTSGEPQAAKLHGHPTLLLHYICTHDPTPPPSALYGCDSPHPLSLYMGAISGAIPPHPIIPLHTMSSLTENVCFKHNPCIILLLV